MLSVPTLMAGLHVSANQVLLVTAKHAKTVTNALLMILIHARLMPSVRILMGLMTAPVKMDFKATAGIVVDNKNYLFLDKMLILQLFISCLVSFIYFQRSKRTCDDVDECEGSPCDDNANCENSRGSFECTCNDGYSGNGYECSEIDECSIGTHECSSNANCANTVGSYTCRCKDGFEGDGKTCSNINECYQAPCSPSADCTDTVGSYSCVCRQGYKGDGENCVDVDECLKNLHNCDINAKCANLDGGFSCACNSGYIGNGLSCDDVNECAEGSDTCSENANCMNNEGSYRKNCSKAIHRFTHWFNINNIKILC